MRQETPRYTRSHRLLKIYISLLSLRPIIQIQFRNKLTSHFYKSLTIKSNYSFSRIPTISNIENFLTFNTLFLATHHFSSRNEEKKKTKNPLRNVEKQTEFKNPWARERSGSRTGETTLLTCQEARQGNCPRPFVPPT